MQGYPLILHLLLIFVLTLYHESTALRSTLSVLTAYLCGQIIQWATLYMDIGGMYEECVA